MVEAAPLPTPVFREGHAVVDGVRIRYMEAGQGHPVVIVDDITRGPSKLKDALARKYRVIAFELPGPVGPSDNAKDLANTMARAAALAAPGGYTLVGGSFGANVALWQTLQSPDMVQALVLISPTAVLPAGGPQPDTPEATARRLFAHPEAQPAHVSDDPATAAKDRELVRRIMAAGPDAEAESRLGEIQCATLVLFGQKDKLVSPEAARVYRERILNSNISFVYDAGHMIEAERPEALINAVADYVENRETFIVGRHTGVVNP